MERKRIREILDNLTEITKQDTLEDIIYMVSNSGQAGCFDEIYDLLNEYKLIED